MSAQPGISETTINDIRHMAHTPVDLAASG